MELYAKGRNVEPELKEQMRRMLPSVLADQFSVSCLGFVNIIMAGHVSSVVLAGVGQVDAINMILVYIFNSFATAGTVVIAQNIGKKDRALAEESLLQSIVVGTLFLSVLAFALILVRAPLLSLLYPKVEKAVMENSLNYVLWSMPSLPLTFIFSQCAGALRSVDSVKLPMIASVVMNIVNALMGFIFIIGFMGIGGYGAFGAGIAIFVSRLIGVLLLVCAVLRKKAAIRLRFDQNFRFNPAVIKSILTIGVPIALEAFLFHSGRLMVQVYVATMGTVMISANQVLISSINMFCVPVNAFQVIMVTLVAQRVGAKSRIRSDSALRYIGSRCEIVNFFVALTLFIFAPLVCRIYSSDQEIVQVATLAVRIACPFYLTLATSFVIPMGFRGAGDVRFPLAVSVISVWIFRTFGGYFLGVTMGFLVYGVSFATGLDWLFRGIFFYRRMQNGIWLEKIPYESP